MKLNKFFGALVVSVGLCGQSFGFELLDRMIGLNNHGSCCETSCCEQTCSAEPTCCDAQPACCDAQPTCCEAAPACGCDAEPSCCEAPSCHSKKRCHKHDLFGGLKGLFHCNRCKTSCCDAAPACGCEAQPTCCDAAPACGCQAEQSCCDAAPACGCAKKRCHKGHGLLHGLFHHKRHKKSCCNAAPSCGCGAPVACSTCNGGSAAPAGDSYDAPTPAGEGEDAAPLPPAPTADPSASYRSSNRVFQASKYVRTR